MWILILLKFYLSFFLKYNSKKLANTLERLSCQKFRFVSFRKSITPDLAFLGPIYGACCTQEG